MNDFWKTEQGFKDLLSKDSKELEEIYGVDQNQIKTFRTRVLRRIRNRMLRMERDPNFELSSENLEEIQRVREFLDDAKEAGLPVNAEMAEDVQDYRIWTQHSIDRETGEPIPMINRYIKMKPAETAVEELAEVIESAEPVDIRPSRRSREKRLGQWLMAYGDMQIEYRRIWDPETNESTLQPTHDEHAMDVLYQIAADYMPETIVDLGDPTDLAALSRFDATHDNFHRTLKPSFQRTHNHFAQLRAESPDSKIVVVDSNHAVRPNAKMMKTMPELYGFTLPNETHPLMSFYRLAHLEPLDVEYIQGYGAAHYIHGSDYDAPPILFKHGTHSSANAGATVRKEAAENPDLHIVRGHGHSFEQVSRTTREGWQLRYMQLGATCLTGGQVEGYHSAVDDHGHPVHYQENWQKQVLMIRDYGDGHYEWNVIDVIDGTAYFNGVKYTSRYVNEEETPRLYKK